MRLDATMTADLSAAFRLRFRWAFRSPARWFGLGSCGWGHRRLRTISSRNLSILLLPFRFAGNLSGL